MAKNLASRVFDALDLKLTMTERGLLAYLLGWFLDEDRGYCELSQTRIAQSLIRRGKLATTSDAYRRTVNVYLSRLERSGLIAKAAAGPGRVARLLPGPILQAAIDSARQTNRKTPVEPAGTCPCCGQVMGTTSAGHGQVSMIGTMTTLKTEPLLTVTPPLETENFEQREEKEALIQEILAKRLALASRGQASPIRSIVAYRRTLQTNSLDALRTAHGELQRTVDVQKQEKIFSTPAAEEFRDEAESIEVAEAIGQQQLDVLPDKTVQKMIDQEVESHLQGENGRTWARWDCALQREQARYHLAVRIGMAIANARGNQRANQLSVVDELALNPQTIHHVGFGYAEESPHVTV